MKVIAAILIAGAAASKPAGDDEAVLNRFVQYVQDYGKSYSSQCGPCCQPA